MKKYCVGLTWAFCPLLMLGAFNFRHYLPDMGTGLHGSEAYIAGVLYLFAALGSCFICPVPLAIWFFGWRDKSSAICFITSLVIGALCLAIFYFDPGREIYSFMAD